MVVLGALERGLSLCDFENLTVGMIFDYVITYNNERLTDLLDKDNGSDTVRLATQTDFERF